MVLEHVLTKVCNAIHGDWDLNILGILWAYRTTYKCFIGKTPFKLVYGQEAVMTTEYIVPSLCIVVKTSMDDEGALQELLTQLLQLEEDHFVTGFHQQVEKYRQKEWHDWHIKAKYFQQGYMVLLYDNKFAKHLGKLQMHWLGPYVIKFITNEGVVQLQ